MLKFYEKLASCWHFISKSHFWHFLKCSHWCFIFMNASGSWNQSFLCGPHWQERGWARRGELLVVYRKPGLMIKGLITVFRAADLRKINSGGSFFCHLESWKWTYPRSTPPPWAPLAWRGGEDFLIHMSETKFINPTRGGVPTRHLRFFLIYNF